jgi:hypothetical protein
MASLVCPPLVIAGFSRPNNTNKNNNNNNNNNNNGSLIVQ